MSKGIYADIEKFKTISIHRDMLDELRDKYDLSTKGDSLLFFYLKLFSMCVLDPDGRKRCPQVKAVYPGECLYDTEALLERLKVKNLKQLQIILNKLSSMDLIHYSMYNYMNGKCNGRWFYIKVVQAKKYANSEMHGEPIGGFFFSDRKLMEQLVPQDGKSVISEMDMFLYFWIHTTVNDHYTEFSDYIPVVYMPRILDGGLACYTTTEIGKVFNFSNAKIRKVLARFEEIGLIRTYHIGSTHMILSPTKFMRYHFNIQDEVICDVSLLLDVLQHRYGLFKYVTEDKCFVCDASNHETSKKRTHSQMKEAVCELMDIAKEKTLIKVPAKQNKKEEEEIKQWNETMQETEKIDVEDLLEVISSIENETCTEKPIGLLEKEQFDIDHIIPEKYKSGEWTDDIERRGEPTDEEMERILKHLCMKESVEEIKQCDKRLWPKKYTEKEFHEEYGLYGPVWLDDEQELQNVRQLVREKKYEWEQRRNWRYTLGENVKRINRALSTTGVHVTVKEEGGFVRSYIFLEKNSTQFLPFRQYNTEDTMINFIDDAITYKLSENLDNSANH